MSYVKREWSCGCAVVYWEDVEVGMEEHPCPKAEGIIAEEETAFGLYSITGNFSDLEEAQSRHRRLKDHYANNEPVVEEVLR